MTTFKTLLTNGRRRALVVASLVVGVVGVVFGTGSAVAAGVPGPAWAVKSVATPTVFSAADNTACETEEDCDAYEVTVTNVGTRAATGKIVIRDTFPNGVMFAENLGAPLGARHLYVPGIEAAQGSPPCPVREASLVVCEFEGSVPPEGVLVIQPRVLVSGGLRGVVSNRVEVEEVGGPAPRVVTAPPETVGNAVNGAAAVFGIQDFASGVLGVEGASDVQAGDRSATTSTSLDWNTDHHVKTVPEEAYNFLAAADPETQIVDLPAGLVGDPLALERCAASAVYGTRLHPEKCPVDSRVGVIEVPNEGRPELFDVYNVVPEVGYPAEFAFEDLHTMIVLRPRVLPSVGGYVVSVSVPLVQRAEEVKPSAARATFWGFPGERAGRVGGEAFLSDPDDCAGGVLKSRLEMDAWVAPGDWQSAEAAMFEASPSQGVTGCGALRFDPSIEVSPETSETDTPSGFEVDLRVPQSANLPGILATPDLRQAVVSLPEGVSVSPGAANGLVGCQERGPEGIELGSQDRLAGENKVQEGEEMGADGLVHPAAGHCPAGSQIGEVEVLTPLLSEALHGHVYVAEPTCGGEGQPGCTQASATNGELYGLYLEVAGSGVIVKLRGNVAANPVTGRLTTTFSEDPQFPFSEVKIRLNGGPRAPLANPQACGTFATTSDLTPWSTPVTADATPSSAFAVGGCTGGFAPSFEAASQSLQAGGLTGFSTTFGRGDGEQDLSGVSVTLPPGLVGYLSEVPLCGEPAAAAGACPEASAIGTTAAAAGAGLDPYWDSGKVYLTGPYNGAPFGLSIVVPAKAGPYNLGNVVVRAAISVNPTTTAVTVTSGALPQMRDGVPFRLKIVNALVNRPGFMVNPTNCEELSVSGTIAGVQGGRAGVSSPFGMQGCKSLPFAPVFSASTQGRASKAGGASLEVKVAYPAYSEANIRSVKTDLPLQLPSRLTTLQKACTAAVFEANPAGCPPESIVGIAKAQTPVLPVALTGPAYIVSHGNEKFPNLVIVLQGDGVRVDLTGDTDIKKGITSSTFKTVPDDPVSSFELFLPEGKFSILGTYLPVKDNYDLCGQKLKMPTEIVGQNGAVIKQTTPIEVTGCTAKKPAKKKTKKKAGKAGKAGVAHRDRAAKAGGER